MNDRLQGGSARRGHQSPLRRLSRRRRPSAPSAGASDAEAAVALDELTASARAAVSELMHAAPEGSDAYQMAAAAAHILHGHCWLALSPIERLLGRRLNIWDETEAEA